MYFTWGCVASTLQTTSEHVSSITTADPHTSTASSRLNWPPAYLNGFFRFAERRNMVSARVSSQFKRIRLWQALLVARLVGLLDSISSGTSNTGSSRYFKNTSHYFHPKPIILYTPITIDSRSQLSRGLRRGYAVAPLPGLQVRLPPGGMSVCRECCVLSGRGLCDGLITRPEESYRVWCASAIEETHKRPGRLCLSSRDEKYID